MTDNILLALTAWSGGVICGIGAMSYTRMRAKEVFILTAVTTGLGAATLYMIFA